MPIEIETPDQEEKREAEEEANKSTREREQIVDEENEQIKRLRRRTPISSERDKAS